MLRYGSTVSAAAAAAAVRELLACSAFLLLLHHCVRHTVLPCVNNCLLCTASRPTDRRCTLLPVKLSAVDILSLVCDHSTVQVHATYTTSFLFEPPHHIPTVFIMHTSGCAASPYATIAPSALCLRYTALYAATAAASVLAALLRY